MAFRALWIAGLCALLSLTACSKKADTPESSDKTETTDEGSKDAKKEDGDKKEDAKKAEDSEDKAADGAFAFQTDAAIMDAITAVTTKCAELSKNGWAQKCPEEEDKKLTELLRKKNDLTFETLVAALDSKDTKVKQIAAKKLYNTGQYLIPELVKNQKLKPELAAKLGNIMLAHDEVETNIAREGVRAAVLATSATDQHDIARKLITRYKPSGPQTERWVYNNAIEVAMRFSRMKAFDLVVDAVKSNTDPGVLRAAFNAPRRMLKWTEEEDAKICEWAASHISMVNRADDGPGRTLLMCKDHKKWRTLILEEFKKRGKAGTLKQPFTFLTFELCHPGAFQESRRDPDICKRTRKLATVMANDKKLGTYERIDGIRTLSQRWPDATTSKLLAKHAKNPDEKIAKAAAKQLAYVKERMAKAKKKK